MTTTLERPAATMRRTTLLDNAVLMRLKIGRLGHTRQLPTSQIEVDADKRRVKASKTILACEEAEAIEKIDALFKKWTDSVCLPSMIENGMHWISLLKVEEVNERFQTYKAERGVAVEVLCSVLDQRIEEDRVAFRGNFNPDDYPTADELKRAYYAELYFVALTAPKSLQAVSEELYMVAKQKMESNIAEATEAVRGVLRAQFADLVNHLVERLTPDAFGKKKIFRDSLTDNFQNFLNSFRDRNLTDDAELARLVEEAQGLMGGVEPEALRTQDGLRDSVRRGFEDVQSRLDSFLIDKPVRRFELD